MWKLFSSDMIKLVLAVSVLVASAAASGFSSCEECIHTTEKLGHLMHGHEKQIIVYLKENYCPTLDSPDCAHEIETLYPEHMLKPIVGEFIIKQARAMCHRLGACDYPKNKMLRQFTCEDCQKEMEMTGNILTGEDHIAEMVEFLQDNCPHDKPHCKDVMATHFPPMHVMTMEHFFKPLDVCISLEVCE